MLWEAEHGNDFDVPVEVSMLEGIRDISWHNDTCPRFAVTEDGSGANLWVDHPDPDHREMLNKRFLVINQAGDCASPDDEELYEGDDVHEAIAAFVAAVVHYP